MSNYIVLLRGINVGGHNKLPMADLRSLLTDNGYTAVSTYIQSGNILLSSDKDSKTISTHISGLLKNTYDYNIPVITISVTALQQCFNDNPFLNTETDIKFLHVTFLDDVPNKKNIESLKTNKNKVYEFYSAPIENKKIINLFKKLDSKKIRLNPIKYKFRPKNGYMFSEKYTLLRIKKFIKKYEY